MSDSNVHASGKIPMQEIAALPPEKAHALWDGIASVVTVSQPDPRADLLERIKALEKELSDVKDLLEIRSNFADAQQREKVKAHAALKLALVALEDCLDVKNADAIAAIKACGVTL